MKFTISESLARLRVGLCARSRTVGALLVLLAGLAANNTALGSELAGSILAPGSPLTDEFVLGPTTPGKWGAPVMGTPGGVVTYSFMAPGIATPGDDGLTADLTVVLPVGFGAAIASAFAAWSSVADISFLLVPDSGLPYNAPGAGGDIRIGAHAFDGPGGVLAHGFYPPVNGVTAAGDIHFDSAETWVLGFPGPGFDVFQVMAHEIGHAIGLAHTAVPGSLMEPFYTEAFAGPQADDISGAQFIYGVPEPSTFGLLALALVGLVMTRRARASRA